MKLTTKQEESLNKLKEQWEYVGKPYSPLGGKGCVMVEVGNGFKEVTGGIYCKCMSIGIEPDGYRHS